MLHLKVAGTGSYLPEERIKNDFFVGRTWNIYDADGNITGTKTITDPEQDIISLTGIRERRKSAPDEFPSNMGIHAARIALEEANIDPLSLTGIIFATVTEPIDFPSAAVKTQLALGAKNAFAYDSANACAGFPSIMNQANSRVLTRPGNYLVLAAECLTKMIEYGQRGTTTKKDVHGDLNSTLFGDGGGAAVLVPTHGPEGLVAEYEKSNPFGGRDRYIFRDNERLCRMPAGRAVLHEASREMLESCKTIKRELGWNRVDLVIPHQANKRIIDQVRSRVGKDGTTVFENIPKYGNMSSATCAIGLDEARKEGIIRPSYRVIVTSFGAGLVTSGTGIQF